MSRGVVSRGAGYLRLPRMS